VVVVRRLGVVVLVLALLVPLAMLLRPDDADSQSVSGDPSATDTVQPGDSVAASDGGATGATGGSDDVGTTSTSTTSAPVAATAAPDGKSSAERTLSSAFVITNDDLQPKSIVASETGLFFAQNMMYRHNVMVFDRAGNVIAEIPDTVDLAAYGVPDGVTAQGSPVEAAFMPDGSAVYVSNYKMYGDGFNPVADDDCDRGSWDDSYVYRIDTTTFEITQVIQTGAVPKFMAVTPDGSRLLVSNWCGFDVSIIDTATGNEITRIDVGRHPRGIAITGDSRYAYVAIMGEAKILTIDLGSNGVVNSVPNAGNTPRHLVLSPDDRYLYVSNNHGNEVRKIDLTTGALDGRAATGTEPRSMVLAEDGDSLYVVNYEDGTVSKVRTSDMSILQTEQSGFHPVGITYDPATRQVWVANYAGSLHVFVDE